MAMTPLITVMAIKERLEKYFDRGFDYTYIRKLVGKVRNEITHEIDTAAIEPRLAALRENYRMMRERLLLIIYWKQEDHPGQKPPLNRDVNEAAKNVVMMDLAILQAEAAAGMYKKPVEELAREIHYEPLSGEVRALVIAAWLRGNILPKEIIQKIVPASAETSLVAKS